MSWNTPNQEEERGRGKSCSWRRYSARNHPFFLDILQQLKSLCSPIDTSGACAVTDQANIDINRGERLAGESVLGSISQPLSSVAACGPAANGARDPRAAAEMGGGNQDRDPMGTLTPPGVFNRSDLQILKKSCSDVQCGNVVGKAHNIHFGTNYGMHQPMVRCKTR